MISVVVVLNVRFNDFTISIFYEIYCEITTLFELKIHLSYIIKDFLGDD